MDRISKDMMLIAAGLGTFEYVLYWLSQHRFMEQPHHYVTALVLVCGLGLLPFIVRYRFSHCAA